MRIAIIKENIVVNVVEASSLYSATEEGSFPVESNTASIGDLYINGDFVPDPGIDRSMVITTEVEVPISVSNVQAYAALSHFDLLVPIRALLANLPEDHIYRLAFEKTHIFKSDSIILREMSVLLNISDEQLKNIFAYAEGVRV